VPPEDDVTAFGQDALANQLVAIISIAAVVILVAASRLAPARIGQRDSGRR